MFVIYILLLIDFFFDLCFDKQWFMVVGDIVLCVIVCVVELLLLIVDVVKLWFFDIMVNVLLKLICGEVLCIFVGVDGEIW